MLKPRLALCAVVAVLAAGLLGYAETAAFSWDEGFHLLAAQSIMAGKRPYLDFVFSQTPLNAYWNAVWMRIFGESWRAAHAAAALATAGAILLAADFVLERLPAPGWRFAAALATALIIGMNQLVIYWGTIGQAYGLCLLLTVAAFRLSIVAVRRSGPLWAGLAGLAAGAAAMSSLLTALVGPVLFIWILRYNRAGRRAAKIAGFVAGAAGAFLPLIWLFVLGWRQTLFGVLEYNLLYRQTHWAGAIRHDLALMASWIDSFQALSMGLLAAAGLAFVIFRSQWDHDLRAEFYLCGWLAFGLCAQICNAHPTFSQYFILLTPFLGILAAVGLYSIGSRMYSPDRPFWPVFVFTALLSFALAKSLYEEYDQFDWRDVEELAVKVNEVTPPDGMLLADEHVYFLTRRTPPSGMELADSHKLELPAALASSLHVVNGSELDRRVRAGVFDTVETCDEDEKIQARGFRQVYSRSAETGSCTVFWAPRRSAQRGADDNP
jgi:4-amino-4-deoxy-L-arabinose transferase-like glycosyltransferase